MNLGIILGPASSDLVDVDLDCPEALRVASYFLPDTACSAARPRLAAHWLYYASGFSFGKAVARLRRPDPQRQGGAAVELRVGGESREHRPFFPPSVHESGEDDPLGERQPRRAASA